MRIPHPAAWIGFIVHCLLLYSLFWTLGNMNDFVMSPQERVFLEALRDSEGIRIFMYGILALQAVGLVMLVTRTPFGPVVVVIGGIPMLPISILYLVGCALTYYRVKYEFFTRAPSGYEGARVTFPAAAAGTTLKITVGALLLTVLLLNMGWMNIGINMMFICLGAAYLTLRARVNHALSLHGDHFTLLPGIYAHRLFIPYTAVRLATLDENGNITFKIETPQGIKTLTWNLRYVEQQYRRQALEDLGAALSSHGVPLE